MTHRLLQVLFMRLELRYQLGILLTTLTYAQHLLFNLLNSYVRPVLYPFWVLTRLLIIRLVLIKSNRGIKHVFGYPVNSQRTRSNARTSHRVNRIARRYMLNK